MTLLEYAITELDYAGIYSESGDDIDDRVREAVLDLLNTLSKHNPSGSTVGVIVSLFSKLAKFEPLSPITGEDDEWMVVGEDQKKETIYQNVRCSHVFKNGKDGKPYDINGRVFIDQDGCTFTRNYYEEGDEENSSTVYITFPYIPKTDYVKVFYNSENGDWTIMENQE